MLSDTNQDIENNKIKEFRGYYQQLKTIQYKKFGCYLLCILILCFGMSLQTISIYKGGRNPSFWEGSLYLLWLVILLWLIRISPIQSKLTELKKEEKELWSKAFSIANSFRSLGNYPKDKWDIFATLKTDFVAEYFFALLRDLIPIIFLTFLVSLLISQTVGGVILNVLHLSNENKQWLSTYFPFIVFLALILFSLVSHHINKRAYLKYCKEWKAELKALKQHKESMQNVKE